MNTSTKTEILSGIGIFFAVWTLTFLYSNLMSSVGYSAHYWFSVTAIFVATGSIISALVIKQPFVIAPGLGVGWFAANQILPQSNLLNFYLCIFICGIGLIFISQLKSIKKASELLPEYLQGTMSIGIGALFMRLALEQELTQHLNLEKLFLFITTILLLIYFKLKQNRWGTLVTVGLIILLGFLLHNTHWSGFFAKPEPLKNLFQLSEQKIHWPILVRQVLEMTLFSFFDVATGIFCLRQIQMALFIPTQENTLSRGYLGTGLNNLLSSFFLCGPNTIFIESGFGMQLGGRRSLSLYVASMCFIFFAFCFPLGQMIPKELFRGVFFFIGLSLLAPLYRFKNQSNTENILSIFLVALIILTKSILNGLLLGILVHYVLLLKDKKMMTKMNHSIAILAICSLMLKFI
jgi:AGZA family xanthine/uracil permease-like MFS transporter